MIQNCFGNAFIFLWAKKNNRHKKAIKYVNLKSGKDIKRQKTYGYAINKRIKKSPNTM